MRIYPKIDTLFVRDAAFKLTDQLRNPVIGDIAKWIVTEAEGIVARPRSPLFDARGNRLILKLKTCDFK